MWMLFALSVVTAGLGVYYRDSCTVPYGCLGRSGLLLYLKCHPTLCDVNETAVDLRQCEHHTGPSNGTDTWLDKGCELMGGGCTRRFVKTDRDEPWCVPVALDENGLYAPVVRVGTTKCRVECDQDYGILDSQGNVTCACPPSPSPSIACDLNYTERDVSEVVNCFCQSLTPCRRFSTDCPCIPQQGVMARTVESTTGLHDVRALYRYDDLFQIIPCEDDRCPVNWKRKTLKGRSLWAMARGFRFVRPSFHMFYQPTSLAVSAWRDNTCVCVQHCFDKFPKLLCLLPSWGNKPVECVASSQLDKKLDLRQAVLPVERQDRKIALVVAANGRKWKCVYNVSDQCPIAPRLALKYAPPCICRRPCRLPACACHPRDYRLFEYFDFKTRKDGLCSLPGSGRFGLWEASACTNGPNPCPKDAQVEYPDRVHQKVFALGYRYLMTDKKSIGKRWLRALPIRRPLDQGECVCVDRCERGASYLQCRLAPDPKSFLSECQTSVDFPGGIGSGVVNATDIPQLHCDGRKKTVLTYCDVY